LTGDWTVELTEFRNSNVQPASDKGIFVYCSVCDGSIVGERQKPLLRRIVLENESNVIFMRPYRVPLRINDLRDVHVYIRDKNDGDVSFLTGEWTVTLVSRPL
jgi:hypothetical protein